MRDDAMLFVLVKSGKIAFLDIDSSTLEIYHRDATVSDRMAAPGAFFSCP
jgi:hypothetical protein